LHDGRQQGSPHGASRQSGADPRQALIKKHPVHTVPGVFCCE